MPSKPATPSNPFYRRRNAPRITVDSWVRDAKGRLLLVRRGRPPFLGKWGLPGGFLEWKERTEECCARETLEETSVKVKVGALLGVYSDPERDPRGHNITVLYEAKPVSGRARGGDDAAEARWFSDSELVELEYAFDHRKIVMGQIARLARFARARRRASKRRAARPVSARRLQRPRRP